MASINEHLHLPIAILLLLLLALFSPAESHSAPSSASKLAESVCQKSAHYASCIKTLEADPRMAKAGDVKSLATIAMDRARKQSVMLTNMFKEMEAKNGGGNKKLEAALKLCAFDFKDAKIFFNPRGLGDMTKSLEIHSALDNYQNCKSLMKQNGDFQKVAPELKKWRHFYAIANGAILQAEDDMGGDYSVDAGGVGGGPGDTSSGGATVGSGSGSPGATGGATVGSGSGSSGGAAGGGASNSDHIIGLVNSGLP